MAVFENTIRASDCVSTKQVLDYKTALQRIKSERPGNVNLKIQQYCGIKVYKQIGSDQ